MARLWRKPGILAAALATMDLIESEYKENARRMESTSLGAWPIGEELQDRRHVRGRGLMIGIEIVRDQRTKERAADLRNAIVDLAFHKGCCARCRREHHSPVAAAPDRSRTCGLCRADAGRCFREAEKKV